MVLDKNVDNCKESTQTDTDSPPMSTWLIAEGITVNVEIFMRNSISLISPMTLLSES